MKSNEKKRCSVIFSQKVISVCVRSILFLQSCYSQVPTIGYTQYKPRNLVCLFCDFAVFLASILLCVCPKSNQFSSYYFLAKTFNPSPPPYSNNPSLIRSLNHILYYFFVYVSVMRFSTEKINTNHALFLTLLGYIFFQVLRIK